TYCTLCNLLAIDRAYRPLYNELIRCRTDRRGGAPMKPKERMLCTLERFSTAMLAALGYLPAAGLVVAAGALAASAGPCAVVPALQGPPLALLGHVAYVGMMDIVENSSVVFCVGIAAFTARRYKHQAGMIALLTYLVFLTAGHTPLQ